MQLYHFADEPDEENLLDGYLRLEKQGRVQKIKEDIIIRLPTDLILLLQDINNLIHFIYPNLFTSDSQYLIE